MKKIGPNEIGPEEIRCSTPSLKNEPEDEQSTALPEKALPFKERQGFSINNKPSETKKYAS